MILKYLKKSFFFLKVFFSLSPPHFPEQKEMQSSLIFEIAFNTGNKKLILLAWFLVISVTEVVSVQRKKASLIACQCNHSGFIVV